MSELPVALLTISSPLFTPFWGWAGGGTLPPPHRLTPLTTSGPGGRWRALGFPRSATALNHARAVYAL